MVLQFIFLFICLLYVSNAMFYSSSNPQLQSVLVLDIDGTLYNDDTDIEYQIAKRCDKFASKFGYSEIEGNNKNYNYQYYILIYSLLSLYFAMHSHRVIQKALHYHSRSNKQWLSPRYYYRVL